MRSLTVCVGLLALSGCSILNSFDAVKPAITDKGDASSAGGKGSGAGGAGGHAGAGGGTNAGGRDAGTAGTGGTTSAGGTTGSSGGAGGGGGSGGAGGGTSKDGGGADVYVPGGDGGAIVGYSNGQLVVIDPKDGSALSYETIGTLKGILNDPLTDLWYLFEAGATPLAPVTLHVRELRVADGKWKELAKIPGFAVPFLTAAALNSRLVYLSQPSPGSFVVNVLNTAVPTKIALVGTPQPLPPGNPQGIVGAANAAAIGGVVDVAYLSSTCPAGDGGVAECDVELVRFTVDSGVTPAEGVPKAVGKALLSGNSPFAFDPIGKNIVMAFPALVQPPSSPFPACGTYTTLGHAQKFAVQDFSSQTPVDFTIFSERFSGAAYDTCLDVLFTETSLSDRAIWAIPFTAGGTVFKTCSNPATSMQLEPYTRNLIRTVQSSNPDFVHIEGTATAPKLTTVSLPNLPSNFAPTFVSVRQVRPNKIVCPP